MTDTSDDAGAARSFLAARHQERYERGYREFLKVIEGDNGLDMVWDVREIYARLKPTMRRVFEATHNLNAIHNQGDREKLVQAFDAAKTNLRDALMRENMGGRDFCALLVDDIAAHASAVVSPPASHRELDYTAGLPKPPVALSRIPRARQRTAHSRDWLAHALGQFVESEGHAVDIYRKASEAALKEIARDPFTADLMRSLEQGCKADEACKQHGFSANMLVSVAADMLREIHTNAPEFQKGSEYTDLDQLYSLKFPATFSSGQAGLIRQTMANGMTSEAMTVVLLACQKQLAREAAITMTKSIECAGTTAARKSAEYVPVGRMFKEHMRGFDAFLKKLDEMQYLNPTEIDVLKRNESVLLNILFEHAEQLKPTQGKDTGASR